MIKWIAIIIIALLALMDIALVVACGKLERQIEEHEWKMYLKWKESRDEDRR